MFKKKFHDYLLLMLGLIILIAFTGCGGGQANDDDEIIIQFGHHDAEVDYVDNPYYAYTDTFKKYVEEKSNNRIKVEVFPNSQLGDLLSMVKQTSRGDLDIVGGADLGLLSAYTRTVDTLSIPYLFSDSNEAMEVLTGEFGEELNEEIKAESNMEVLSYLATELRHFSNSKHEIKSPDDMKGLDIRTQEISIHETIVKSLGANPTTIPFEEAYSALETGVVDGQENAPYTMMNQNLHEVTDYYTLDGHLVNTAVILINDEFFNELSENDQELIREAADEAQQKMLDIVDGRLDDDLKAFEESGIKITELTDEERQEFSDATQDPVVEELRKNIDDKWIDKIFNAVDEVKNK